jgi:hypothetical protein
MAVSGKEIRQSLVAYGDWVFLGKVTAASNGSYIEDTQRVKGVNLPSTLFDGARVRIASGSRQGETSYIDYLQPSAGRLYLTPALSGSLSVGDEYEIWLKGIDPDIVDRLRDDALSRFCSQWRLVPLSIVPGGDLADEDVSTKWSIAGGASVSFRLAKADEQLVSRRIMSVTVPTAETAYAKSTAFPVHPSTLLFVEAPISAFITGSPEQAAVGLIKLFDVTNGQYINTSGPRTEHTGPAWGRVQYIVRLPSNCYRLELHVTSKTSNATVEIGAIAAHPVNITRIALPDRITTKSRVGTTFVISSSLDRVHPLTEYKLRPWQNVEREQVGEHVFLRVTPPLTTQAVFYYERSYYPRLQSDYYTVAGRAAGDAATTDCPLPYIQAALAERVSKYYMDIYGQVWQDDWMRASSELNYWENEFGPEPHYIEENTQSVYVPQLRV